jgi:hypothetical protein
MWCTHRRGDVPLTNNSYQFLIDMLDHLLCTAMQFAVLKGARGIKIAVEAL